jgi:hypothetical protein
MTGPRHYKEAERLLDEAEAAVTDPRRLYAQDANTLAAAQAHATLALVAVMAATGRLVTPEQTGDPEWERAMSA